MQLDVDPMTAELTWETPRDALFVTCAVFTCRPILGPREIVNEADKPPDTKGMLIDILNSDACIFELHTSDSSRTSLVMGGQLSPTIGATCEPTNTARRPPVISQLSAACWAYNSHQIVSASDIFDIDPGAFSTNTAIPQRSDCTVDDELCYEPTNNFFGACAGGTCQPRCDPSGTAYECEQAAHDLFRTDLGTPGEDCPWMCKSRGDDELGVCVPKP